MLYIIAVLTAAVSYFIGSINTSIVLSKSIYGSDIRSEGSGNAGTTNMLRTHGKLMGLATLLCDILKGTLAIVVASWLDIFVKDAVIGTSVSYYEMLFIADNLKYIAGIFVVLGHDFPIFFGFRGGKGVATSLGVVLALNWQVGLIVCAIAIVVIAVSRYVSLGSITAATVYPFILFTYLLTKGENPEKFITYIIMSFILALLIIAKHHANISRLKSGTENKLFAKKAAQDSENFAENKE